MTIPYLNNELAKIPEYHPRENKLVLMKFEETCIPIIPKIAKNLSQSIHNNLFEYIMTTPKYLINYILKRCNKFIDYTFSLK